MFATSTPSDGFWASRVRTNRLSVAVSIWSSYGILPTLQSRTSNECNSERRGRFEDGACPVVSEAALMEVANSWAPHQSSSQDTTQLAVQFCLAC